MPSVPSLVAKLRGRIGPTKFWSDIELSDAVIEALRVWQAMTGLLTGFTDLKTSGVYVDVPKQYVHVTRIQVSGTEIPKASIWELDQGFVGWEGSTAGTPGYWAPHGMNSVAFYPAYASPTATTMAGIIDLPRGFAAGVEFPFLNEGDEQVLLDYAQHYLSIKEGQGELEATQSGRSDLIKRAGAANARLRKMNFYRNAMARDRDEGQPGAKTGQDAADYVRGEMAPHE